MNAPHVELGGRLGDGMPAPFRCAGFDWFERRGPTVDDAELFIERDGGAPDKVAIDGEGDCFGRIEECRVGDKCELGDIGKDEVDAVAAGGFSLDRGDAAGF